MRGTASPAPRVFVAFGGNVGAVAENLQKALAAVARLRSTRLVRLSSLYRTAPIGVTEQPPFLNGVAELATELRPDRLFVRLLEIERSLGRTREVRWGPRTVDLDVVLWGDRVIREENLEVPHPRMHERAFVMVPLAEIAPGVRHPVCGRTATELRDALGPRRDVECLGRPSWARTLEEGIGA